MSNLRCAAALFGCCLAVQARAEVTDSCTLQGRYLLFFASNIADPLDNRADVPQSRRSQAILDAIASGWRGSQPDILIAGHLDAKESRTTPTLDLQRAKAVREALESRGVHARAIWIRGDALSDPMVPGATGPEIQNRYVSIKIPAARFGCPSAGGSTLVQ